MPELKKLSPGNTLNAALAGCVDIVYPSTAKIVRIFTSSTFTDTAVERNSLMENVYPRLKTYCQERGYEFQVVDMRWGVNIESTVDHMTSELCMRELKECQRLSTGPNFITFLAQKYGYRPFPRMIPAQDFDNMMTNLADSDLNLLKKWWFVDENAKPEPQYVLQPITHHLPHYADKERSEEKTQASASWWSDFERMQVILRSTAEKAFREKDRRHVYHMSVTEDELTHGVLRVDEPEKHCHWFNRTISDMLDNLGVKAPRFIDMVKGEVDEEAKELMEKLKDNLSSKLPEEKISKYELKWCDENGIDIKESKEHEQYIKDFTKDFYDTLTTMIDAGIEEKRELLDLQNETKEECVQHAVFAQEKLASFHGRQGLIDEVKARVLGMAESEKNYPLIIYGETGSGKTALMAKLIELLPQWGIKKANTPVIVRFIGTTMSSTGIQPLLASLCRQISVFVGKDEGDLDKQTLKELKVTFTELLQTASEADQHLFLLLDSLDQLDSSGRGRDMKWLKLPLPSNVIMVMSTLPGEEYKALPTLKKRIKREENFVELLTLEKDDIDTIINENLHSMGRTLTSEQMSIIQEAVNTCAYPLYLKLALDEAAMWKSYTPLEESILAESIQDVIHALFERLEKYHGHSLVSHALGYITCSKSGLSESELEDILSCDDTVLNDVYQYWTPPTRRLPPLLWVRIRYELREYLTDHGADGIQVINWYHRQFVEVATERYLQEDREQLHTAIADYFLGTWAKDKKSYKDKKGEEDEADRHVATQPFVFKDSIHTNLAVFNLRKMSELPYNLSMAEDWDRLKSEVFCNLEFLFQKLRASGIQSLLDDIEFTQQSVSDPDLDLLHNALQFSRQGLAYDTKQLPTQLCARILTLGDEQSEFIQDLIAQAQNPPFPSLVTKQGFLPLSATSGGKGGEHTLQKLQGHESSIEVVTVSESKTKLATYDMGETLRVWDIDTGRQVADFTRYDLDDDSVAPDYLILCHNDELLIGGSVNEVDFFDVIDCQVKTECISLDPDECSQSKTPILHFEENDWLLVLTAQNLKVYDTTTKEEKKSSPVGEYNEEPHYESKDFFEMQGSTVGILRAGTTKLILLDIKDFVSEENPDTTIEICPVEDPQETIVRCALLPDGRVACLSFKADCYYPTTNPAMLTVYSRTGDPINEEPYELFQIPYGNANEFFTAMSEDKVMFSNFEADTSVLYTIDVNTGKYKKTLKYTSSNNLSARIKEDKICLVGSANVTVADIIQVDLDKDTSEDGAITEEEEEESPNQVSNDFKDEVDVVTILPTTSRYAALGGRNFWVSIWDLAEMKEVRRLIGESVGLYCGKGMMMFPTYSSAVTVNAKNELLAYDLKTFNSFGPHPGFGGQPISNGIGVVKSHSVVGHSADSNVVKVMKFETGNVTSNFKCKDNEKIANFHVGANGDIVLCFKREGKSIIVWDHKKKKRLAPDLSYEKKTLNDPTKAAVTNDGKYVIYHVEEATSIVVWELDRPGDAHTLEIPKEVKGYFGSFIISRTLKAIVAGFHDGTIGVYSLKDLKLEDSFNIYEKSIDTMIASEDGSLVTVITFMEHNSLTVIDLKNKKRIGTVTIDNNIWHCQFTRDNNFLLMSGGNIRGVVQFYLHHPEKTDDDKSSRCKSGRSSSDEKSPCDKALKVLRKKRDCFGEFMKEKIEVPENLQQAVE